MRGSFLVVLLVIAAGAGAIAPASAQAPGLEPQRDCQTVRTCNFSRTGAVRGCLSSYTCKVCRFVQVRCRTESGRRVCDHEARCSFGG